MLSATAMEVVDKVLDVNDLLSFNKRGFFASFVPR